MYYKKICSEHLYLSPMDIENEVDIMTRWVNEDTDIAYYNGFYGSLLGKEKVQEMMLKWNEGPFGFSIVSKEDDTFMGHVSFFNPDGHEQYITMGVYLGKEYRHKGLGKEAMSLAIHYMFQTQRFHAIHLEVFSFNQKAIEVYKKLGFVECGRWHKARYHMGESHDVILMELFREEFYK